MRLIYLLLLLLALYSVGSSALRCYICEDCDEQSLLTELETCSVPALAAEQPSATGLPAAASPSPVLKPNPSPAASPAAPAASAPAPAANVPASSPSAGTAPASSPAAASESEDEDDYDSDEEEAAPASTLGIMPAGSNVAGATAGAAGVAAGVATGTATGTAASASAPAAAAADGDSEDEEEEEEDYDYPRKRSISRLNHRQVQSTQRAVCYIASLRLNGTEITNRGCTLVTDADQNDACKSLFDGWSVVGCQLCEYNGCNSPINAAVVGQWHSSSGNGRSSGRTALAMTLLAVVASSWICN
ncbi:uncharacterized protein LOC111595771 [Drosophila hydei]|uniref:Uncharacterized protein LOC111595771 n=1 Tax=Drosophila hydei TaxID=7224 RepID=A0A6J1LEI1_DROHY|nr:uncharacterized protein LOC111595771 [Drosophila hydei]